MKRDERGIALVITLFLMATLSALAVSMMFLAQTETASSRNYRTMSQARYAAEAGVHEMTNYLMYTYSAPASPFTGYDVTKVPVTCTSGCTNTTTTTCDGSTVANAVSTGCIVVGYSASTSNNPSSTTNTAASGTLAVNSSGTTSNAAMGTVTYGASAILMSMKQISVYGSSGPSVIQTWQIVSDGTVPPSTAAIVEVSSSLEREVSTAQTYAVFATNGLCGSITIAGHAGTNSYNSGSLTPPVTSAPATATTGGGIGTNGNLNVSGSVAIGGTLSTPRTGAGACSNNSPDAVTGAGSWSYGGTNHLSQSASYPTPVVPPAGQPAIPSGTGTTTLSSLTDCTAALVAAGEAASWSCNYVSATSTLTVTPTGSPMPSSSTLTLGNVAIGSNTNFVIAGNNVNLDVNSFTIGSNATMALSSSSTNVAMNIAGQNLGSTLPLDLTGGGSVNTTGQDAYLPSHLQILYAGTGQINMVGNNSIAATVYAPNANVQTHGHGGLYGSILSNTFTDTGGATINYDTSLATSYATLGNFMLTSFSWKKY